MSDPTITPEDVYHSVGQLKLIAYFVTFLIISMMVLKVWETTKVIRVLRRVENQLKTASDHGRLTDKQRFRVDETLNRVVDVMRATVAVLQRLGVTVQRSDPSDQLQAATVRVTEEIRKVPQQTADLVEDRMRDGKNGGSHLELPAQDGQSQT